MKQSKFDEKFQEKYFQRQSSKPILIIYYTNFQSLVLIFLFMYEITMTTTSYDLH